MSLTSPLDVSQLLLGALSTQIFTYFKNPIPNDSSLLVVSNHRSFMDAPILMSVLQSPIRFACHHYMGQIPLLREIVTEQLGCLPLEANHQSPSRFLKNLERLLQLKEAVGIFPEGTDPMVTFTQPNRVGKFQRGFAHLALRARVENFAILPVAIASLEETNTSFVPLKMLSFFDPTEPLFNTTGWHPLVIYRRVAVFIGSPYWIMPQHREKYQGKQAKSIVLELTNHCESEINNLLKEGCY